MNPTRHIQLRILRSCLILAVVLTGHKAEAVMVNMTVTDLGGSFRYDVSVDNDEAVALAIVSIVDAAIADRLIDPTLVTPAGFLGSYDDALGFIDFIAGAGIFAPGSIVSGFSFESLTGPGTDFTRFQGLTVLGGSFGGLIDVNVTEPETGAMLLLAGLGWMVLAVIRGRSLGSDF